MTRLDGIVCLGDLKVDHRRKPERTRAYRTAIADDCESGEDRAALRPRAMRGIQFDVIANTAADANLLQAVVAAATQEGNACAPLYGRGWRLITTAAGASIVLGPPLPKAGDWLLWEDPLGRFYRKVLSVADTTVTFTEAFPRTLQPGTKMWPMIFGRFTLTQTTYANAVLSAATVKVVEPMGVGTRATQSCPVPSCPTPPTPVDLCEGPPVLSIDVEGACGSVILSWLGEPSASWKIYKAPAPTGPWTLVTEVFEPGYSTPKPLRAGSYYAVTVIRGSVESDRSNVVFAAGVRLELLMRVVQERYIAGGLGEITWYDRVLPSVGNPGTYPADGYYDADIAADPSGATEGIRLQHIFDQLTALASVALEDSPEDTTAPAYMTVGSGPLAALPHTVTAETLDSSMRLLVNTLCAFNHIAREGYIVDASSDEEHPAYNNWKSAEAFETSASAALAALASAWGATMYAPNPPPIIGMEGQTYHEEIPPDSGNKWYYPKFFRARGTVAVDLTGMAGSIRLYMMCGPYPDGPQWESFAPVAVDSKYHSWRAVSGNAPWESELLNGADSLPSFTMPYVLDTGYNMGWRVGTFSDLPPILAVKETWTYKL